MTTMAETARHVTAGADTHRDQHVVAALDERGAELGVRSFPTTPAGHRALLAWLRRFGAVERVGVEGTGSYGAGLARFLHAEGVTVVEVNRPNRQLRARSHGKSDPVDAVAAARAAQSGQATGAAKTRDGAVEAIRALRVARRSASHGRSTAINQMRALLVSGPDDLRETLRGSTVSKLVTTAARFRPADPTTAAGATRFACASWLGACRASRRSASGSTPCWSRWFRLRHRSSWLHTVWGRTRLARCWSPPATTLSAFAARRPSPISVASPRSTLLRA